MKKLILIMVVCVVSVVAFQSSTVSVKPTTVPAPVMPEVMKFAGEELNLDRFDLYERLDREIISLSYGHTNTLLTIKRANRYFPEMAAILKSEGIPFDFVYLAATESHLDPKAVSYRKAAGFWQFMPKTAEEYGLEVNSYVDERYHLEKSTRAACRYFKRAYKKYGSWVAAAASYNAGMARISNAFDDQQIDSVFDLYLNSETSRYICRLYAFKTVMENPQKYGFKFTPEQLYQPIACREVKVTGEVKSWVEWAKQNGTTYQMVRLLNPWIVNSTLPNTKGHTYMVKVPKPESIYRSKQSIKTFNENWIK